MRNERPVAARGLLKRYGELVAVDQVDLTLEEGDVYGFLGPNGAGKTTTLRILLGLIRPDAGEVRLFGRDPQHELPDALTAVAGFVETPAFYSYLSGRKNLELLAAFDGGEAGRHIDEVLEIVELSTRAKDKVGGYSQGMRQRLGIAASLLRRPRLLLLDEPTHGLDPAGMRDVRALTKRLADEGMTILLSSHLLAEVQEICNRVAIIRSGRIVYEGSISDLQTRAAAQQYRLRTSDPERGRRLLLDREDVDDVGLEHGELTFRASEQTVLEISRMLVGAGLGISALIPEAVSLESIFFELTEGALEPSTAEAAA